MCYVLLINERIREKGFVIYITYDFDWVNMNYFTNVTNTKSSVNLESMLKHPLERAYRFLNFNLHFHSKELCTN